MKNLLFTLIALVTFNITNAQDNGLKTLTPGLVDQTSNNGNLKGNNALTQARTMFLNGHTSNFPGGITLGYTNQEMLVSFAKNHSRLNKTDGSMIAPVGTPVFWVPGEYFPRYVYCLNKFSTFAPKPTEVVYQQPVYQQPVVIRDTIVIKEVVIKEVQTEAPAPVVTQAAAPCNTCNTTPDCSYAHLLANQVIANYQNGSMFQSAKAAQAKIDALAAQYPECLTGFTIEKANKFARWTENNAVGLVTLGAVLLDGDDAAVQGGQTQNPGYNRGGGVRLPTEDNTNIGTGGYNRGSNRIIGGSSTGASVNDFYSRVN